MKQAGSFANYRQVVDGGEKAGEAGCPRQERCQSHREKNNFVASEQTSQLGHIEKIKNQKKSKNNNFFAERKGHNDG